VDGEGGSRRRATGGGITTSVYSAAKGAARLCGRCNCRCCGIRSASIRTTGQASFNQVNGPALTDGANSNLLQRKIEGQNSLYLNPHVISRGRFEDPLFGRLLGGLTQ